MDHSLKEYLTQILDNQNKLDNRIDKIENFLSSVEFLRKSSKKPESAHLGVITQEPNQLVSTQNLASSRASSQFGSLKSRSVSSNSFQEPNQADSIQNRASSTVPLKLITQELNQLSSIEKQASSRASSQLGSLKSRSVSSNSFQEPNQNLVQHVSISKQFDLKTINSEMQKVKSMYLKLLTKIDLFIGQYNGHHNYTESDPMRVFIINVLTIRTFLGLYYQSDGGNEELMKEVKQNLKYVAFRDFEYLKKILADEFVQYNSSYNDYLLEAVYDSLTFNLVLLEKRDLFKYLISEEDKNNKDSLFAYIESSDEVLVPGIEFIEPIAKQKIVLVNPVQEPNQADSIQNRASSRASSKFGSLKSRSVSSNSFQEPNQLVSIQNRASSTVPLKLITQELNQLGSIENPVSYRLPSRSSNSFQEPNQNLVQHVSILKQFSNKTLNSKVKQVTSMYNDLINLVNIIVTNMTIHNYHNKLLIKEYITNFFTIDSLYALYTESNEGGMKIIEQIKQNVKYLANNLSNNLKMVILSKFGVDLNKSSNCLFEASYLSYVFNLILLENRNLFKYLIPLKGEKINSSFESFKIGNGFLDSIEHGIVDNVFSPGIELIEPNTKEKIVLIKPMVIAK